MDTDSLRVMGDALAEDKCFDLANRSHQAADEIDRLRQRVADLNDEKLRTLAACGHEWDANSDTALIVSSLFQSLHQRLADLKELACSEYSICHAQGEYFIWDNEIHRSRGYFDTREAAIDAAIAEMRKENGDGK